jgi:hypothetical protein
MTPNEVRGDSGKGRRGTKMKLRIYKKKVKKYYGKNNVKFHRDRETGQFYMATRISEKLTFATNFWWKLPY